MGLTFQIPFLSTCLKINTFKKFLRQLINLWDGGEDLKKFLTLPVFVLTLLKVKNLYFTSSGPFDLELCPTHRSLGLGYKNKAVHVS